MATAPTTRVLESSEKRIRMRKADKPELVTLLELVEVVSSVTSDEREVVATVLAMLRKGRVRLRGNFRDTPVKAFED